MSKGEREAAPRSAAAYVRMSTEHQKYSTSNQMDVINAYALAHGIKIQKVFSDEGKSGLSVQGRHQLSLMLDEVESGTACFECILVYDVSRWGRFQDADESAYLEYRCHKAGATVHYCAEQFENDGSSLATIVKGVKRAMAGEYSRELSSKVFQGACRLIQLGYKQGGTAGFGLRRMLIDQNGQQKALLQKGEKKSIQTDRVILVAGPEEEVSKVRWMYRTFATEGKSESDIAQALNSEGILTDLGRAWTRSSVHQVLTNEKYIGNNVYYRTSFKLKQKHITNPKERWVRGNGAFEAIVDTEVFHRVQAIILARSRRFTDQEMLDKLRELLSRHGRISGILINETEDFPSSIAYRHRFGSLFAAYRLIGYTPQIDYSFIETNRNLREKYPHLISQVIEEIKKLDAIVYHDPKTQLLHVNDELRVSIVLSRHLSTTTGSSRWIIRLDESLKPDITVACRMNATNDDIHDYYLLPAMDMTWKKLRLSEDNGTYLDAYRFESLDYLFNVTKRTQLKEPE